MLPEPPLEPEPDQLPPFFEPLADQLPRDPSLFAEEPEPPQWLPEDQPELPERLIDIVQVPPQLPSLVIWPLPLDHVEPLLICQLQLQLRLLHCQRPELQPSGQPCRIQFE